MSNSQKPEGDANEQLTFGVIGVLLIVSGLAMMFFGWNAGSSGLMKVGIFFGAMGVAAFYGASASAG